MRDDSSAAALVTRARNGEKQAWDELIERYAPLIWSICRGYRLSRADADDVGQSVWLGLLDHLASLRDPTALPGWLATTTRRECGRVLYVARRPHAPGYAPSAGDVAEKQTQMAEHELLTAERHTALREAFAHLPPHCQQLIAMLIQDPPVPYAKISAKLGIPVESIGPTRARCLDKLRQHPAIAALINADGDQGLELANAFHQAPVTLAEEGISPGVGGDDLAEVGCPARSRRRRAPGGATLMDEGSCVVRPDSANSAVS